jgi:hypothetical protein
MGEQGVIRGEGLAMLGTPKVRTKGAKSRTIGSTSTPIVDYRHIPERIALYTIELM